MANSNFTKSIGGSYGSGPINAQSIGISQSSGGPVAGYNMSQKPDGVNVSPVANDGGNAVTGVAPKSSGGKNTTHARGDGKPMPKPSKTRA
jgi:hypothetical protein